MRYSFRLAERDRRLDGDEERGTPTRRRSRKRRCSYVAADHLNPEEKPAAANVVRFFDNGEKNVVKLIFSGQDAEPEEIVCTPEHPFYVIDRGWICAKDLQLGDFCLSANGERIAFISRENLAEKQRVYNFEVEEKHTFYIDSKKMLLVHNQCVDEKLDGLKPEVLTYFGIMFGANGQELLRAYFASGRNTIESSNLWFSDSKGEDSGLEGSFWRPSPLDHYRIKIDSDVAPMSAAILLYEELLESRTSVYVAKYLESEYFTDEFIKNRLGQLDVLKQLAAEIEDNVLLTASIASEPIDWVCSVNEYLETGNVKPLIIGLIPFIPNIAKAKGVWLSLKKAADLDANDILKFHKHSGIGAGARSGMHGVPYNKAATDLEQLAKEPGLLPEYRNELLKKAEEFRQKAHEINHLMR